MPAPATMRARRYAPLGHCMYCLASGSRLSEEHLIPKALGGRWTLRDSVCGPCRAGTGRLEQIALNGDFAIPKTLLALKRRRARRPGPRRLTAPAAIGGAWDGTALDARTYPRAFALPAFAPAGLLCGIDRRATPPSSIGFVNCRLERGAGRNEAPVEPRAAADPAAFGYSIAKWAYAFAAAERGLDGCDTDELRRLLTGGRADAFNFVGMPDPRAPAERALLHSATLRDRGGWRTVMLNVFGAAGMPPYEVVIGPLEPLPPGPPSPHGPTQGACCDNGSGPRW
ncbi:MAG: hypothetical protein ABW032_06780 [Burkholderiaceae bacterium]